MMVWVRVRVRVLGCCFGFSAIFDVEQVLVVTELWVLSPPKPVLHSRLGCVDTVRHGPGFDSDRVQVVPQAPHILCSSISP